MPSAFCSRASTRAPTSIASETTRDRALARLDPIVEERGGRRIVDDDVLDDHAPHQDVHARLAKWCGGLHAPLTVGRLRTESALVLVGHHRHRRAVRRRRAVARAVDGHDRPRARPVARVDAGDAGPRREVEEDAVAESSYSIAEPASTLSVDWPERRITLPQKSFRSSARQVRRRARRGGVSRLDGSVTVSGALEPRDVAAESRARTRRTACSRARACAAGSRSTRVAISRAASGSRSERPAVEGAIPGQRDARGRDDELEPRRSPGRRARSRRGGVVAVSGALCGDSLPAASTA